MASMPLHEPFIVEGLNCNRDMQPQTSYPAQTFKLSGGPVSAPQQNNTTNILALHDIDTLAEWLRRRPAKPMGSPRVGSNPTGVELLKHLPMVGKGSSDRGCAWVSMMRVHLASPGQQMLDPSIAEMQPSS